MSNLLNEDFNMIIENEYAGLPGIKDPAMKKTVKTVLENTLKTLHEDYMGDNTTGGSVPAAYNNAITTGAMDQYTPVIISLIRRTLPTLVGPQMIGMQAMNLPTGRIFCQRVYSVNGTDGTMTEVWRGAGEPARRDSIGTLPNETNALPVDPMHSGASYDYTSADGSTTLTRGVAMDTANGEALGWKKYTSAGDSTPLKYNEMAFGIDSMDVSVKTRALKGRITTEVMQDLRSVHGLDAEQELANILQTEITAEIDREIVNRIYDEAVQGGQNCVTKGVFDFAVDADGRWSMEKVMGLLIQIEREATLIAQATRRGRGNFILTSPEVAAYLSMANLITTQFQNVNFTPVVNPVGVSYYGLLANRFKVFVDPYLTAASNQHILIVGYKGTSVYDAGLFYCPYVPVQWFRATGEEDFGQRLGIKSRYGLVSNPYSISAPINAWGNQQKSASAIGANMYFRKLTVVL